MKLLIHIIAAFFRLITGFFATIFKFLFKRVLVRIYYEIFRFKKHYAEGQSGLKFLILFKKNLAYIAILLITIVAIFSNHQQKNLASAAHNPIGKTIMADLIKNQFSDLTESEELIIDSDLPTLADRPDSPSNDYYLDLADSEPVYTSTSTDELDLLPTTEAVALKPSGVNVNAELSGTTPGKRDSVVGYTVELGDTVSSIAQQFGISINTILWANNLTARSLIRPGDELSILPVSGLIHTVKSGDTLSKIAQAYSVSEDEITNSNRLSGVLKINDDIIIPGGVKATVVAAAPSITPSTGIGIISDLVKSTNAPEASTTSGSMLWPTEGHRITQYFSWSHTGLDIANKQGTPLYASEGGTVEFSGWSNGYGYNVVINHGGGKKTRYAHASQLFVAVGDQVVRGENIAAMGSTGWSTGPHIHFEVIINGVRQNPLNYIK